MSIIGGCDAVNCWEAAVKDEAEKAGWEEETGNRQEVGFLGSPGTFLTLDSWET